MNKYVYVAHKICFLLLYKVSSNQVFTPVNTSRVITPMYSEAQVDMNSLRCLFLSNFFFPKIEKKLTLSRTNFKY